MRVYIAGIRLSSEHEALPLDQKIDLVIALLKQIAEDTKRLSKDTLVFVLMHEYALTIMKAITPYSEVQDALAKLRAAIKLFPNMVLVPGSFSSVESIKDQECQRQMSQTLLSNYKKVSSEPNLNKGNLVEEANKDFQRKHISQASLASYQVLRNSTYLFTSLSEAERHKSAPYLEHNPDIDPDNNQCIFYIGDSNPIVKVATSHGEHNIGVLICVEQHVLDLLSGTKIQDLPVFEIIVSATIDINDDKLFGALNMQMDSEHGLRIIINYSHPHANVIDHVDGFVYEIHYKTTRVQQVGVIAFNGKKYEEMQFRPAQTPQPLPQPQFNNHVTGLLKPRRNDAFSHFKSPQQQWPRRFQSDSSPPQNSEGFKNSNN